MRHIKTYAVEPTVEITTIELEIENEKLGMVGGKWNSAVKQYLWVGCLFACWLVVVVLPSGSFDSGDTIAVPLTPLLAAD